MADEIKLSNLGLSNLWSDTVTGQNKKADALGAIFRDFWQNETPSIADKDPSDNKAMPGDKFAAVIESNDIKTAGFIAEIINQARLSKPENNETTLISIATENLPGQRSEPSEPAQHHFYLPFETATQTAKLIQESKIATGESLLAEKTNNSNEFTNLQIEPATTEDGSFELKTQNLHSKTNIVLLDKDKFLPIYDFIVDRATSLNEEADEQNYSDMPLAYLWQTDNFQAYKTTYSFSNNETLNNHKKNPYDLVFDDPLLTFFSSQNVEMPIGHNTITKPADEKQKLIEARYQDSIFKSISASGEISSNPLMVQSLRGKLVSFLKYNDLLVFGSHHKNLWLKNYPNAGPAETYLTVLPKVNSIEGGIASNFQYTQQISIDGKSESAIAFSAGIDNHQGVETTVSENKKTNADGFNRITRVDVLKKNWEDQVVSKLVSGIKESASRIDLILQPKKLGEVSVQILNDANNVNIKLTAESQSVANLFKATENQLQTLLSENGMKLAGFTVGYDNQGKDNRNTPQSNSSKNSIHSKKRSEKSVINDSTTESVALSRHVGDYDYLV